MARSPAPLAARRSLLAVLSTMAGAVDVIGSLTLGGLLTAHITGNLVLASLYYVNGRMNRLGPILALPVFVLALALATAAAMAAEKAGRSPRRGLLVVQAVLLAATL